MCAPCTISSLLPFDRLRGNACDINFLNICRSKNRRKSDGSRLGRFLRRQQMMNGNQI